MCICPIHCLAHSRCSINISRISSETEAVTREAVLSITGSASPLKVLPQLLASSLSVRRKVWNKHYQRRRGETQEQRGRSGQEEKDNPWRRMFFEQHLLTPSTFSLWGQCLSSEWTGEWHASAWWTRTQNSLAARAEISCPVDIFGCFQQSAGVCIHTCWLSVIINTIMTAINGCCELGNTCIISQILTITLWAMH